MSAMTVTHRPQPIIPTDSYSDVIRASLAGRPTAPLDPEPPRRSRIRFETLHRLSRYIRDNARLVIFAVTVGFVAWAILAVIIMARAVPQQPTYRQGGGAVMVLHAAPIVTPTVVSAVTETPTAQPTIAPIVTESVTATATVKPPAWLTQGCIYQMQVVVEGEIGGVHDQQAADFVAAQVLYTALASQCRQGMDQRGSIQNVWFGWRKYAGTGTAIVLTAQTSNAVNRALVNLSKPLFPKCLYTGSATDVFGVWLKADKSLSIDVALPSYPQAPQVFGLDCPQGK